MSSEKCVVLGSNSFSGASFIAHALKEGVEIVGMSRSPEPSSVFLPYKWIEHEDFSFCQMNLNCDLDRMISAIDDFRPDYVINFAAQSMVGQSWDNPEHWFMTNVVSTVKLHDRLRECSFLKKYVHVSTPEVYGNTVGVIKEDAPYNPSTPYAVSKAACDMSLKSFLDNYSFPVVFTRAANICGPGQQLYRIIPRTIYCILSGERLQLQGGGTSERSFIHAEDVARATLSIARDASPGSIYHLSTDRLIAIRGLVEEICRQMDVSFKDKVDVVGSRPGHDEAYKLDSTRAQQELGWNPAFSVEEIVDETIGWMKKNWEEIQGQPKEYVHKQ